MRAPFERWTLCVLLLAAMPAMALDPAREITQYGLSVWRAHDGMPQGTVSAITQTPDGYLWLGTIEGLARFDGAHFTKFDRRNTPILAETRFIGALMTSADGSLWIGRGNGLARYRDGRFTAYPAAALSDSFIWSMAQGKDDSLWIGTYSGGLNRLQRGKFSVAWKSGGPSPVAIWSTFVSRDGAVWLGTNGNGLTRLAGGKTATFTTKNGLSNDIVWAIHQDRSGALWVGTNGGLNRIENGKITTFTMKDGLSSDCVKQILEDRDGNLWIGTEGGGLNRYARGRFTSIGVEQGLVNATVDALYEDREGNLWIGFNGGVMQLRDDRVVNITRTQNLAGDAVWTVREARDGSLLVGTTDGFTRWKNGKATTLSTKNGLSSNVVRSVLDDADGGVWLATNDGLNHWKDGKVTVYRKKDGLPHDMIRTLHRDRAGFLWIGTRGGGLARFDGRTFTVYDRKNGLAEDSVASIDEDVDGSLWIATTRGVSVLKNGRIRNYGKQDGLAEFVRATYHDRNGVRWTGTYGGGLHRMKNGRFVAITTRHGLYDDVVLSVVEAGGYLWMSCNRGIFRVAKKQLDEFADGKRKSVVSETFDMTDGMKNAECNGGSPSAWKGSDGRLYFPTAGGVAVIDPKKLETRTHVTVRIEEVLLGAKPADVAKGSVVVEPGPRNLEIRYTATTFIAPNAVVFRYRLRGFSDEWIDAGTRRSAFYTNLPPGDYDFELMARTSDGAWHTAQNPIAFRVRAAFYETYWFYAACIALLILAIGGGFRVRLRIVERREQMLVDRVHEQTSQLSMANKRKRLILNAAAEGIFGLDNEGVATFINPAAAQMLGWQVDELVGVNLHDLTHARPGLRLQDCAVCSVALDWPVRGPLAIEFRARDGRNIPVECTASTIIDDNGASSGVVVTFRDVTERKAIERMKDEFVSTVSHELRTPLTSIRGALGLLTTGRMGELNARGQRLLEIANDNADRLVRLVNDILDLERLDSGSMRLTCSAVSAQELIRESCDAVESMADEMGIAIVQKPLAALVWADSDRIGQVLRNLLSNAVKFSPRGMTVTISATADEHHCTFRVEDSGRGVPQAKFESIFERFQQVDASDSRDKGGTGLGLAISRSIVELHGGRIWVESNAGGGAIFQFTVPIASRASLEATA